MNQKDHYSIDELAWKKAFSDTLRSLMNERGISANKLAAAIDIDTKSIRNYLDCKSIPNATVIVKLAAYFNVSTDYFLNDTKDDIVYSERTILALAALVRNFDIMLTKEDDDGIALHVKDDVLSMILKELYYTKCSERFSASVEQLTRNYGNMKVYQKHLISPSTFYELIRHEYIYHDLEDDIIACTDQNGNDCFGMDEYTFEECEKRMQEWDEMSTAERDAWWEDYCTTKHDMESSSN